MLSCTGSSNSGDRTLITAEDTGRVKSVFKTAASLTQAAEESRVLIQHEKIYVYGAKVFFLFFFFFWTFYKTYKHTKIKSTSAVSQGALGADVRLDDTFQYAERFSSGGPEWDGGGASGVEL